VLLMLLSVGVAAGAVYGGFHYATDALAGFALGGGLAWVAPAVAARMRSTSAAPDSIRP
jgi:membrane-associated phospholipid phosphatase